MKNRIYYFNPEHDLSLANNDCNFNAPESAIKFAKDLSSFPLWYANSNSFVLVKDVDFDWWDNMKSVFQPLHTIQLISNIADLKKCVFEPWGWDEVVCKQLNIHGNAEIRIPEKEELNKIRQFSHRSFSLLAMKYLNEIPGIKSWIPSPAKEIFAIEEAELLLSEWKDAIFKAPWSGSGKGILWAHNTLTDSIRGWCYRTIKKQGSVIAEQVYTKVQDFALEYYCNSGNVNFKGYSLFDTENGIYRSNTLMCDGDIERQLELLGLDPEFLMEINEALLNFLKTNLTFYTGFVGVDMFLYSEAEKIKLHPCVEINLRMTMGMAAHTFYEKFVNTDRKGFFYIDHLSDGNLLFEDHLKREKTKPLQILDGKINSGYLSLTIVKPDSLYRVRVEID